MGKVKKAAANQGQQDSNNQAKISSFFQKSSEPAASKLFTQLGQRQNTGKGASKLSLKKTTSGSSICDTGQKAKVREVITIDGDNEACRNGTEGVSVLPGHMTNRNQVILSNKKTSSVDNKNFSSGGHLLKGDTQHAQRTSNIEKDDSNKNVLSHKAEPVIIPETQFRITPDKGKSENLASDTYTSNKGFTSPFSNTDCDNIVPGTPDAVILGGTKPKRPLGRSFLSATSTFGTNPFLKPKPDGKVSKKKLTNARKSLISVSVKFQPETSKDIPQSTESTPHDLREEVGKCKSISPLSNGELNVFQQSDRVNLALSIDQDDFKGTIGDPVYDNYDYNFGVPPSEDKEDRGVTPTKQYNGGSSENASIKRMAKSGLSPDAKRCNDMESCADNARSLHDIDHADQVTKQLEFDDYSFSSFTDGDGGKCNNERSNSNKLEVKHQEKKTDWKKLEQQRKKQMNMKFDKMVNYQMSGESRQTKSSPQSLENGDDGLNDILQELNSPSVISGAKLRPKSNKVTNIKAPPGKPVCAKSSLFLEKSMEMSEEDKDFFSKLGMDVDSDVQKAYEPSMESGSMEQSNSSKSSSDIKVKLGYSEHESVNMEINEANTETEVSDSKQEITFVPRTGLNKTGKMENDKVLKQHLDLLNINMNSGLECDPILDITDLTPQQYAPLQSRRSGVRVTGRSRTLQKDDEEKFVEEVKIEEFATQTGRPGTPVESEIREFVSQGAAGSLELCKDFQHLSPFILGQDAIRTETAVPDIFQKEPPCVSYGRHIVTDVTKDSQTHETVLTLTSQPGEKECKCILQGFWVDTHISAGDVVHIQGQITANTYHVTDKTGLIVVNPDLLLSGTTVVSSVFCMRKSVLNEKFKGCDSRNIYMLNGSIIHSLFQQVLRKKLLEDKDILKEAESILKQNKILLEIYGNATTEDIVLEEVKKYLPPLQAWTKQYTNIGQDMLGGQRTVSSDILVTKVHDIEENIWSPRFGIKGKIDLTVEAKMQKERGVIPLELKTGKPSYSIEHKGQVTLYSMMCGDRRRDPGKGLLLYLKEPTMKLIEANQANQRGLVQMRNEMAYYLSRQVQKNVEGDHVTFNLGRLPEPISNIRACQKCPQLLNCSIYQKYVEDRPVESNEGLAALIQETTGHLSRSHIDYFIHWCLLLDLEVQTDRAGKTLADIWCKTALERENGGDCLGGMILTSDPKDMSTGDLCDSVTLTFTRHKQHPRVSSTKLNAVGLNSNESVVLSTEKPSWVAICTGFVQHVTATNIEILVDRDSIERLSDLKMRVFRIDRCNSFSTAGIFYTNLSTLMANQAHSEKLRKLIIDKQKPCFLQTLSKGSIEKVKAIFKKLNKPQKTAILKVLMCQDYVLIKGYPGTGKTSTIVALVKVLNILGLSVLLTSYTHSAVDNILLKLVKEGLSFARVGRVGKIHPDIRQYSVDVLTREITSTAALQDFLHSQQIVATSCLGTNHPLFSRRRFDVCIVDEASQVVQPACLGPLFCCSRFVLVGDPKQLPPVVQSKEARELGMDESLFMRLDQTGATFELNLQYRMNSEIMYISNELVYNGCLKCGSEAVAGRTLQPSHLGKVQQIVDKYSWMSDVLNNSLERSVIFLNTNKIGAEEVQEKHLVRNYSEANIVMLLVQALLKVGISTEDIGVIAPYRSQVQLIRNKLLEGQGQMNTSVTVETNTVDQYQGRDKSVILISFVRSSTDKEVKSGQLLQDVRRLNVAVTRAKCKLIMIGDVPTLSTYKPLEKVISLLADKGQIIDLPEPV